MAMANCSASIPVDDIAKAVSGAVSSVLAKLQNKDEGNHAASDSSASSISDFYPPNKKGKKEKKSNCVCRIFVSGCVGGGQVHYNYP